MNQKEKEEMRRSHLEARRKRRRRRKIQQIILIIILVLILIAMGFMLIELNNKQVLNTIADESSIDSPEITPTAEVKATIEPTPDIAEKPMDEPEINILTDNLNSSYGYMIRLRDQFVMMDKGGSDRIYPASMTKLMTLIVAIENLPDLDDRVILSDEMIRNLYEEGASMAQFVGGENVPARDLLYGVMLPSGADACVGLAQKIAGSEEVFVEKMNQKAQELEMTDTHFTTATGLHDENEYSTCKDITKLMLYSLNNETFREILNTKSYTTAATPPHPNGIVFENSLFKQIADKSLSNGGIIEGGKTGYTSNSGLCLASISKIGEEEYLLVTAHADGSPQTEQYNITDAFTVYNQIK